MAEQMELPFGEYRKTPQFANPVPELQQGAEVWSKRIGKTHNVEQFANLSKVGPGYHALYPHLLRTMDEPLTDEMKQSYESLRSQVRDQYQFLTSPKEQGGLGIAVEVSEQDPYSSPQEMHEDVSRNKRLKVMSTKTTGGHALFSDEENDMFRAVHDAFGHLATGRNFAREGEEAAYGSHASMFTDDALPALVSETRAQNAYLINAREFPPNKPFNVPDWATKLGGRPPAPRVPVNRTPPPRLPGI